MSYPTKPSNKPSPSSKSSWSGRKTILIVNEDMNFGLQIAKGLCPDGHEVLGPVTTLDGAYTLMVNEKPTIAVLDATMSPVETSRLSDMFLILDVPHLVVDNQRNTLIRRSRVDGQIVEKHMTVDRPLADEICDAIWDIHSRSLIFDLLDGPSVNIAV